MRPKGWRCIADAEGYISLIEECHRELEQIFFGDYGGPSQ